MNLLLLRHMLIFEICLAKYQICPLNVHIKREDIRIFMCKVANYWSMWKCGEFLWHHQLCVRETHRPCDL